MSGLGRRSSALGRPLEGWRVASKRLGPLPRRRGDALAHGCGRSGRGALPLPRAAVISTRVRVQALRRAAAPASGKQRQHDGGRRGTHDEQRGGHGDLGARYARCAVRTVRGTYGARYVRYGRGWYAYLVRTVRGALGASRPAHPARTPTREAGTRGLYVPHGGPGAYVSAQTETTVAPRLCSAGGR